MGNSYYDVAQICLKGHVINAYARTSPQHNQKFCHDCGSPTVMNCPECGADIRGEYRSPEVYFVLGHTMTTPKYCYNCGKPYPWTSEAIKAARAFVALSSVDEHQKKELMDAVPALTTNTSSTGPAATIWDRFLRGPGKAIASGAKEVLVEIVSETAKRIMFPSD